LIPAIRDLSTESLKLNTSKEKTLNLPEDLDNCAADIVMRVLFGLKPENLNFNGHTIGEEHSEIMRTSHGYHTSNLFKIFGIKIFYLSPAFWRHKQRIYEYRQYLKQKLIATLNNKQGPHYKVENFKNLIEIFAENRKDNATGGFSDDEILDEFDSTLTAGKHTIGTLMTMTFVTLV